VNSAASCEQAVIPLIETWARERSKDAGIELFALAIRAIYITADKGEHHADTNLPAR
jgi:hypothetical protein